MSQKTLAAARRALRDLLRRGACDARGQDEASSLRRVLEELAGPGGPLRRRGRALVYAVGPEHAAGLRQLQPGAPLDEA